MSLTPTEQFLAYLALAVGAISLIFHLTLLYKSHGLKILSDFWLFFSAVSPWSADHKLQTEIEFLRSEGDYWRARCSIHQKWHSEFIAEIEGLKTDNESKRTIIMYQREALARQTNDISDLTVKLNATKPTPEIVAYLVLKDGIHDCAIIKEPANCITKQDMADMHLTFRPLTYAD